MTATTLTMESVLPDWQRDKRWSDQFLVPLKRICGEFLIGEAPQEEDRQHNTDLIVLGMKPLRIACRVRRFQYFKPYQREFTIRSARASGAPTELKKILSGWGEYFLYAFAEEDKPELYAWALSDLGVFRRWYAAQRVQPGILHYNADRCTAFHSFCWCELPTDFIIAKGGRVLTPAA